MDPSSTQNDAAAQDRTDTQRRPRKDRGSIIGGIVMIVLGLLFLLERLVPDVRFSDYWPLILVAIGVGLLWNSRRPT
jgi:phage shock protein C